MKRHCMLKWGITAPVSLISIPLLAVLLLASPAVADGGLAISGSFYSEPFEIWQGSYESDPDVYLVVFNNAGDDVGIRMMAEGPEGVYIDMSPADFSLAAGGQRKVLIGVGVGQNAFPGECEISITAESYVEDVGGIQIMGVVGQSATLVVLGEPPPDDADVGEEMGGEDVAAASPEFASAPASEPTPTPPPAAPASDPTPNPVPTPVFGAIYQPVYEQPVVAEDEPCELEMDMWGATGSWGVDSTGVLLEDAVLVAPGGKMSINIPKGTKALTPDGEPLSEIVVVPLESSLEAPEGYVVLSAFDFGPDGASFEPGVEVRIAYGLDALAMGLEREDLSVAMLDEASGEWRIISGGASFSAEHFSVYALMAPDPQGAMSSMPVADSATPVADDSWMGIAIAALPLLAIGGWLVTWRRRAPAYIPASHRRVRH